MLVNGIKILLFFLFFIVNLKPLCGQNVTLQLRVISGGNLSYIFNSLGKYETGISYENWTRLQVSFNDTTDAGDPGPSTGWELRVKATTIGILSDGGNPPLDTESIQIRPTISFSGNAYDVSLTNSFQTIVEGVGNQNIQEDVVISYDCGVDSNYLMIDNPPDYYYVDLEFKIFPI